MVGGADLFVKQREKIEVRDDASGIFLATLINKNGFHLKDDEFLEDEHKIVPGLGEMGQPVHLQGPEATEVMETKNERETSSGTDSTESFRLTS